MLYARCYLTIFPLLFQCLIKLEKPGDVALILNRLFAQGTDAQLMAYQVIIDIDFHY